MSKNELYIEQREEGDFAVRKPGSERAVQYFQPKLKLLRELAR
jgi:hypothetical protein